MDTKDNFLKVLNLENLKFPIFFDFFIQGTYKNEPLLEEFLLHIFYDIPIKNEKIFETEFFNSDIDDIFIEKILPLKTIPHNFNNKYNTFLKRKENYFQINITTKINNQNKLNEIIKFIKVFHELIINEKSILYFFYRINFEKVYSYKFLKGKLEYLDLNETDLNLFYIEKLKKYYISNFFFK